jgi:PAP2 superfamily protein
MAELAHISGNSEVAPSAPASRGWAKNQRLALIGGACVLALWIVVSPNLYAAVACLLMTLVYASRVWTKLCRLVVFAVIPNNLIWSGFVYLRGLGDSSPLTPSVRLYARRLECWLFGGEMPSSFLQRHLFDPNHPRPWDYFFLCVHMSFFLVPSIFFCGLWWTDRARFHRYVTALIMTLGVGVVCFWLIPSNPPWMNPASGDPNPVPVVRVNSVVAEHLGIAAFGADGRLDIEENSLAAMPSIHLAVTFLCALAWRGRRRWGAVAVGYFVAMTFSLVYLGEHHVVDEIAGVALALVAWRVAPRMLAWLESVVGTRLTDAYANAEGLVAARTRRLRVRLGSAD